MKSILIVVFSLIWSFTSFCQIATSFNKELEIETSPKICSECISGWSHSDSITLYDTSFERDQIILLTEEQWLSHDVISDSCTVFTIALEVYSPSPNTLTIELGEFDSSVTILSQKTWNRIVLNNIVSKSSQKVRFSSLDSLYIDKVVIQRNCSPELIVNEAYKIAEILKASEIFMDNLALKPQETFEIFASEQISLGIGLVIEKGASFRAEIHECEDTLYCYKAPKNIASTHLEIYNYVSPNGDKKNDTFVIEGLDSLENYDLIIFDEQGAKVFDIEDGTKYENDWNGEGLNAGIYYYYLKLENEQEFSGGIFLDH